GVVRGQGRKIIFSTNLPNVGDLDDALVRPGRCFARIDVRELLRSEATALIHRLASRRGFDAEIALAALAAAGGKTHSLAQIYQAMDRAQ
ncbi:hypothetical protein AB4084_33455, partial [Lysobacter sp. 2RAB21]